MSYQTKRQLRERIRDLEYELKKTERLNGVIEGANLPKCESEMCRGCIYCHIAYGIDGTIIGCTKRMVCADYQPRS